MFPGERGLPSQTREGVLYPFRLRPTISEPLPLGEYDIAFNKLIAQIIDKKVTCTFIQPHFDDNIFSAGGLMRRFTHEAVPVISLTVMSNVSAENNDTQIVQKILSSRGCANPEEYINQRRVEDGHAMTKVGVEDANRDELGEVDVIFRPHALISVGGEMQIPRSTGRIIRGTRTGEEERLVKGISAKLIEKLSKSKEPQVIFVPVGLGLHKDHLMVRDAAVLAFGDDPRVKLVFYQDIPYAMTPDYFAERDHINFLEVQKLGLAKFGGHQLNRIAGAYEYLSELMAIFKGFQSSSGQDVTLPLEGYYLTLDPLLMT